MAARPIQKSKLLLVEGSDDKRFFAALLASLSLNDIQVEDYGGKDRLRSELRSIRNTSGFAEVASLGVTRDADTAVNSAFQAVQDALRDAGLDAPSTPLAPTSGNPKITVWLPPGASRTGEIEDLCLDSVAGDPALACVDNYMNCLTKNLKDFTSTAKAKLYAFMSSQPNPRLRLGEAAEKGLWPFSHAAFDEAKRFLSLL